MISEVHSRRGWTKKETEELKLAYEKDELDQFAASHGRTLGEVNRKARIAFVRQSNQSADNPFSMSGVSGDPLPPYSVSMRRASRAKTKSAPGTPVQQNASTAPIGTTEAGTEHPKTNQHGAITKHRPEVTDEMIFKSLQYYPSDAYNIVRLRSVNVSFEVLSQLSFKGTYTPQQLRKVYDVVSQQWGHVIPKTSWPHFENLFRESFAKWYLLPVPGGRQGQSYLLPGQGTAQAMTAPPRMFALNNTYQNPPASAYNVPMTPSRTLYQNPQFHTSPSGVVRRAQTFESQQPAPQQPGNTLYDAFPSDYIHQTPQTQPFREAQINYGTSRNQSLAQTPLAPNQLSHGFMDPMGQGVPDWSLIGTGSMHDAAYSPHQGQTQSANFDGQRDGAQPSAADDVEDDGFVTYRY